MSLGDILGQVMQNGMGGRNPTNARTGQAANSLEQAGGGIGGIFGQLQNALANAGVDTAAMQKSTGDIAGKASDFLRNDQAGGMSGAQIGGIGAAAGALLGGGLGGAAKGGAMAILGTLALGALRNAQAGGAAAPASPDVSLDEVKQLVGPDAEKLALRAMISAAKADGQIDQSEMEKIIGKLGTDQVSPEDKEFVMAEMRAPLDIAGLASQATSPAQAAEVYAASLLAIEADTAAEQNYLRQLAAALNLDAATVMRLHDMTGAPSA